MTFELLIYKINNRFPLFSFWYNINSEIISGQSIEGIDIILEMCLYKNIIDLKIVNAVSLYPVKQLVGLMGYNLDFENPYRS